MPRFRRPRLAAGGAAPPPPDPAWLAWRAAEFGARRAGRPGDVDGAGGVAVDAVVVDVGYPPAWATLVVRGGGSATVAASSGGRLSREASQAPRLLAAAEATLHLVPPADAFPLPPVGSVAFHLLASDGGHSLTARESELRSLDHPLALLFSAARAVLAELRPN